MAGCVSLHCSKHPLYHNPSARTGSLARAKSPVLAAAASQLRRLHLRGERFALPCCRKYFVDSTPAPPPHTAADGVLLLLSPIFRVVAQGGGGQIEAPKHKI